jgi:hypothetical protein
LTTARRGWECSGEDEEERKAHAHAHAVASLHDQQRNTPN